MRRFMNEEEPAEAAPSQRALQVLIPARKKADSEGLRRFESDGVDSSFAEHVMPSPMIELIRGGGAWLRFRSKRG